MYVKQLHNKNQFVIIDTTTKKIVFQSYESKIAEYDLQSKELTLFSDWDYSNTTRKHLYLFINEYTPIIIPDVKNKRLWIEKNILNGTFIRGY